MKRTLLLIHLLLVLALALSACGSEPASPEEATSPDQSEEVAEEEPTPEPTPTTDTGYDKVSAWAGSWSGSWTNTTYGTFGPIEATIEFNMDGTGSFTFDAGGFIFGVFDPPALTFDASYDASGVTIDLPGDEFFGDVTVTIIPEGTFTMIGDVVPTTGVARVEAVGTFSESTIEGTYTVFFDGTGFAEGTFTLSRNS